MYYLETGYGKHNRLRNAVLLALAAHAALVLAVSFDSGKERYKAPQIAVTLSTQPSQDAPDDARHMAQTNQVGSGEQADVSAVTSRNSQLPSMSQALQQNLPPKRDEQAASRHKTLTTTASSLQTTISQQRESDAQASELKGISPEVDRLIRAARQPGGEAR